MSAFIHGRELSRSFFMEVVEPLLGDRFPSLRYAAALLGHGSEVLGYDTEMSTDHEWGPRVDLFLGEDEPGETRDRIDAVLRECVPTSFRGHSTHFGAPDPKAGGTRLPVRIERGPIHHRIGIWRAREFFRSYLGADVARPFEPADWLTFPQQKLRTITSGPIFRDDIELEALRTRFSFYPHDVWLYLLASGWARIGQEEHLMGRAGSVGDDTGAAIIAARLVRDLMRLCFLMEKVYAPYPKWLGTAFRELQCAAALSPYLGAAVTSTTWQTRERALVPAYELVASMHNALGVTAPVPTRVQRFFGRPFQVIALNGFVEAIVAAIQDDAIRRLVHRPLIGGLDQFSDSTDLIENPEFRPALKRLYEW